MSTSPDSLVRRIRGGRGALPVPGPDGLRPGHRVVVLVVVIVIVSIARLAGQPTTEAASLVLAAGAVAAQLCRWLGGQSEPQLGAGSR